MTFGQAREELINLIKVQSVANITDRCKNALEGLSQLYLTPDEEAWSMFTLWLGRPTNPEIRYGWTQMVMWIREGNCWWHCANCGKEYHHSAWAEITYHEEETVPCDCGTPMIRYYDGEKPTSQLVPV